MTWTLAGGCDTFVQVTFPRCFPVGELLFEELFGGEVDVQEGKKGKGENGKKEINLLISPFPPIPIFPHCTFNAAEVLLFPRLLHSAKWSE